MGAPSGGFFLFIGTHWYGDAAADKLKASGIPIKRKVLYSRPDNWASIYLVLADPSLMGAVVKLTPTAYRMIASPAYAEPARQIFQALSSVSHVVFVHESLLSGKSQIPRTLFEEEEYNLANDPLLDPNDPDSYKSDWRSDVLQLPDRNVRATVSSILEENSINVISYQTNAELSVLATAFIDDNERNLLFRLYVPSGRLYAAEADKLLSLFRDWLSSVGKHSVRQDGYRTAAGQVYEFFGDESLQRHEISREFDLFSKFLTECVENPAVAAGTLSGAGLNRRTAEVMVARYGKEVRRLQMDIRQERESRLLAIRHSLEAELLDAGINVSPPWAEINDMIDSLVPVSGDLRPTRLLAFAPAMSTTPVTLNVNQSVINAIQSTVVQSVYGNANLGSTAKELLDLARRFGGAESAALESAIYEFEDPDARPADRLGARQKLKTFLLQLGGKVEDVALHVLQAYLESKVQGS
jgi:hypothetical protein